jgi:ribonuclease J
MVFITFIKKKVVMHNLDIDKNVLHFVPMGGSEQFGTNFNLYSLDGKWLAIDLGIGFADHRLPGVDIILPDVKSVEMLGEDLVGLVITHAHEDHIGAVPYLWPRLQCPIYCSEFTAAVLRKKFREYPECREAKIHIIGPGTISQVGPFTLNYVHVAHSIPDTVSVFIETKAGNVLHSGDWNLDPDPVLCEPTDEDAFREIGKNGNVLAYVGDSTNAPLDGYSGSESDVEKGLEEVFKECNGRIGITIFASNIGRIQSICKAAEVTGRSVAVVGRSLHNMIGAAQGCGYLKELQHFLKEEDLDMLPRDKQVLIMTGSQGEARAALARVARGDNRNIKFGTGDTVVFSARPIPGNEKEIDYVKNNLISSGVKVITPDNTNHMIHVSGHPRAGEIQDMLQWLKPKIVVPVHGERMQLEAQARVAKAAQIENVIVPMNGSVIALRKKNPEIIHHVETGVLAVEPNRIIDADHKAIIERRKLQYSGALHVSVALTGSGELACEPEITTVGLIDPENEEELDLLDDLYAVLEENLDDMPRKARSDDEAVSEELRIGMRRYVMDVLRLKPKTTIHILRV